MKIGINFHIFITLTFLAKFIYIFRIKRLQREVSIVKHVNKNTLFRESIFYKKLLTQNSLLRINDFIRRINIVIEIASTVVRINGSSINTVLSVRHRIWSFTLIITVSHINISYVSYIYILIFLVLYKYKYRYIHKNMNLLKNDNLRR